MNRYLLLIFGLIYFTSPIYSQEESKDKSNHFTIKINKEEPEKTKKVKIINKKGIGKLFTNTDLSVLVGGTQFFGDIKQWDHIPAYDKDINFFEIKPAFEISLTKKIDHLFSIQTTAVMGKFGGIRRKEEGSVNETYDPYSFYQGGGEYFVADFKELDLQVLLNISNVLSFFSTDISTNNTTFYLKGGMGYNIFNTVNRNLETGDYIYSYGYSDEQQFGGNIKKSLFDSPAETVYIFGMVGAYEINDKFSLLLDITKRMGKTDKWDASLSTLNHNTRTKYDNFNFYAIGASYNIGGKFQKKEWVTPLEGLEKRLNKSTANIEWLAEDADHDGVSDAFDKEVNTPMGVSVDGSGVSLDVDMDNVPDYLDTDPFSSRGAIVDENGVEFDSDNDGIPDSKDLETNTTRGSIVNQYGISVSQENHNGGSSYFPSIYFESGSYYINNANLKRIATIAIIMNNNPDIRLNVIGNTDKNGTTEHNKELAKKRAKEVIQYLFTNFGIDENRFDITNNGETRPLSNEVISEEFPNINTLSEINRRVDFHISN